ncbi:carboxypeptidase N subunit 2 [Entelurus aequoreus]|uniref:carboxypeptidase N subunit 2 n=1 Tax=Entelurus aequoreus TaxID=161455 RepID=UPI002B1DC1B8|nr:carboxypeptidase N subunit 2 [Entelurus aequoreus]
MGKGLHSTMFVLLLLCHNSDTLSHISCPYRCQCFTPVQVLCADEHMASVPRNISKEVKEVIIMTSSMQYLFPNSLEDVSQLEKLIFFNNALRSIHSQAFQNLTDLSELEISGNPSLEQLFLGTFSTQANLTKLHLNYNKFHTLLPGMFNSLKGLETLQMKGNVLSELPTFLFLNLQNLRELDLSLNNIQQVESETFPGLVRLEILKLNNNHIGNISSYTLQHVAQLTELHLEGNKISELADETFSVLPKLQVLNLRGNRFTTFSGEVLGSENSSLTQLDLRGNRLMELSFLNMLTSLTHLFLASNQLSSLPEDIFRNISTLEILDLSENQLTWLPEIIFTDLKSIKMIYLHKNQLSRLDAKLFMDQHFIKQLYLSDNQLQNLPVGLLDQFALPHMLRLHGNPWKCDCHMWYLHELVLNNSQDIEMLDRMLCESPDFLRRRPVASIDKDELLCRLSQNEVPDVGSCSLHKSDDSLVIRCKVETCSPLTVKVQFLEHNGSIKENIWKNPASQCSNNATATEAPMP